MHVKKYITVAVLLAGSMMDSGAMTFAAEMPQRGGTLLYGRYADSNYLEPVLMEGNNNIWILSNIYDTLLLPSRDGKSVEPGLASAWSLSADGKQVTITLREGIKFSDGSPITAEDVKWSLERASKPGNGAWQFTVESIDNVTLTDNNHLVIHLKHADPAILSALTVFNTGIMPERLFEATPGKTDAEKAAIFAEHPVGSGPFILKSWRHNASMTLVKNPYYWKKGADGKPLPYLDAVQFEIIPDDATRILKLKSGELDGAEFIPYSRVNELKSQPEINMMLFPSTRTEYISMNVRPELQGVKNPLSDVNVRQALNYATDKNAIIQLVTYGIGTPMSSYISSATPGHIGNSPLFPVDMEKAKALLIKAGYPNGFSTHIMLLSGNEDEISIGTALQQMWAQIGINLVLDQVDNATRTDRYRKGDFTMRLGVWTDDIADPNEVTSYFAYSKNISALHSGWRNDQLDRLFEASQSEMDSQKRASDYRQIQDIFNQQGPVVPLYESPYPVALQHRVHDFVQIPLGNNLFTETWLSK
ncbi:ABC transporter substrate-binding protein [Klebsiella sp. 1RUBe7cef]|mgnify:FL=1|uniref:ABC transporter substrate-binding protein n=4 Tax=Bacteria TaxID=2 RepID=A0A422ZW06_KLEPN|nr:MULTISPECIES: ABC transporter substrate-binding protein [Klebsiella]MCS5775078.1 ABC transporter substrate-binding protein [Klebsiella variicola subsp. variicola]EKQ7275586.1 ABC transporter substrate-binding protein [Klebsiella pneumoniae]EKU8720577.1 ABC transporter substrate-binding protein [Klebsiella pneumoniae]EKW2398041.1 ABC transporter substrate-binding protein [Klebsiella pneumoniae]EKZ6415290.1 ABC transporter substrate-binding protein [Klebsiella pneumoniae]